MKQQLGQAQQQQQVQQQQQTMTAQQMILVRMLELPLSGLKQRIEAEKLENPALEDEPEDTIEDGGMADAHEADDDGFGNDGANDSMEGDDHDADGDGNRDDDNDDGYDSDSYDMDSCDSDGDSVYFDDDDTPDYLQRDNNRDNYEPVGAPLGAHTSIYDELLNQIGYNNETDKQRDILEYLIGSLQNNGLLDKTVDTIADELAVYQYIDCTPEEVEDALHILQSFEPAGVGARSLQESLLLQLQRMEPLTADTQLAIDILTDRYDDFSGKHFDRICRAMNLDDQQWQSVLRIFSRLSLPSLSDSSDALGGAQTVIPDFIVTRLDDGTFDVRLNSDYTPTLRISKAYRDSLRELNSNRNNLSPDQVEVYSAIKRNVDRAQGFINAIAQRRYTLLRIMETIVRLQPAYFEDGDESLLQPMILKDVARHSGFDISTVSRATQDKYVCTDFGVQPLKKLFNISFVSADGTAYSRPEIKNCLQRIISGEDPRKPYSDEALKDQLEAAGFPMARRTVTKYRETMGIPKASLRRR